MERIRKALHPEPVYEPLSVETGEEQENEQSNPQESPFSWLEYSIFLLLGVSMLWAWNMFLAAGPYLQDRFRTNAWVYNNFQSSELVVSTLANLGGMLVLTKMQANASYPRRIMLSLGLNMVVFLLLAISTRFFLGVSAQVYFGFIVVTVFVTSLATALCQNGVFAFVAGFDRPEYTQGIMAGQGVAGVLPCVAQIVLVLSVPAQTRTHSRRDDDEVDDQAPGTDGRAAFGYFLTATGISALTLVAFLYLLRLQAIRSRKTTTSSDTNAPSAEPQPKKSIPLYILLRKLRWLASAVFLTFAITMVFPVYTQRILSVNGSSSSSAILRPASFIPLAFLLWNIGDLLGRVLPAVPALSLTHRPRVVFLLSVLRIVFIPLYQLCNIRGQGALVKSDTFYLLVVQGLFGLTNGYVGSTCMMGAGLWVAEEEREAAGGFMGLCLVLGLAVGSGLSFLVGG